MKKILFFLKGVKEIIIRRKHCKEKIKKNIFKNQKKSMSLKRPKGHE